MSHNIYLQIQPETYQRFQNIHAQLNASASESLAKPLGDNLADIACEIIDQVFGRIARLSQSKDHDSEKVVQHIVDTTRKYMPWSVSFFSNERLTPMVNYVYNMTHQNQGDYFVRYPVEATLVTELMGCVEQMKQGNNQYIAPALKAFTQVVDVGVTHLVREPKKMLKFNVVVDKTLNGVIHLTTQMGYKRFDKLGQIYDAESISHYFEHFLAFLDDEIAEQA